MQRYTKILLAITTALYVFGIVMACRSLYNLGQGTESTLGIFNFSTFVDAIGLVTSIFFLLSIIAASWILYRRARYSLAMTMGLAPLAIYMVVFILPYLFWS